MQTNWKAKNIGNTHLKSKKYQQKGGGELVEFWIFWCGIHLHSENFIQFSKLGASSGGSGRKVVDTSNYCTILNCVYHGSNYT